MNNDMPTRPDLTYRVLNNNGEVIISEKELMINDDDYPILEDYTIKNVYLESFVRVEVGIKHYLQNSFLIYESDWIWLDMSSENSRIRIYDLSSILYEDDRLVLSWKSNIYFANYIIQSNGETIVV